MSRPTSFLHKLTVTVCRFQWPCAVKRVSATARLLGLQASMGVCRLLSVVCCQVDVSVTGRSLVQRSPTECGLSVCDRGTSVTRHWPIRGCLAKKKLFLFRITGILHYMFLLNRPT